VGLVSIVLPAYNEADNLEACVKSVREIMRGQKYEIIIAEDGSTDGTDKIARALAKRYGNVFHLHHDERLGRGLALKKAFEFARGDVVVYIDVDMATNPRHLLELISYASEYDVVTGSRYLPGSKLKRPFLRKLISIFYNFLVNVLLGCEIRDLQCGFKAFSRKFVKDVISKVCERSWAWDTIVLVVALKSGYKVKEFPVEWEEKKRKKHVISPKRIARDFLLHGKVLLKLFLRFRLGIDVRL